MKSKTKTLALFMIGFLGLCFQLAAVEAQFLWQIGKADTNNAEFALAPDGSAKYQSDGFFAVGESDASKDWPYVQPGSADSWAGSRQHPFTILFVLKTPPGSGDCRLTIGLLDTHSLVPPKLRVQINGRDFEQTLPRGAGDESLQGNPAKGRLYQCRISFPAELLRAGDNQVKLTTHDGSWILYDYVGLETPGGAELGSVAARTVIMDTQSVRALRDWQGKSFQPVSVTLRHFGETRSAIVRVEGSAGQPIHLQRGEQTVEVEVPAVGQTSSRKIIVEADGQVLATGAVELKPVRKLTVYVLPHSHTDIGYTESQSAVEAKQMNNLLDGIAAARRTAGYPEGARFVWNVEVLWAADLYLQRLNESQRADFFEAVKKGQVVLNGSYLNELTGLCRPEELLQLFRPATKLSERTGVPIDSAMISDVPGYTWGLVPAMAQAGIKYFSTAPNYFDRIGSLMREWENKPFYWLGPDGKSKVLVWIPFWGYAMSHIYSRMSPKLVGDFCDGLDQRHYPYDIAYVRWSGHGDNAVPDPDICDFVKGWNEQYTWPHFVIAGTSEAFRAFEKQYGDKLPVVCGDLTPYWEDGAASSALESAVNRQSSERLNQAQTLFAMHNPAAYPVKAFDDAWKSVLLYSEHTWGAWCSVSQPERPETKEQWAVKKSYADRADRQSRELLEAARQTKILPSAVSIPGVDVVNTLAWSRTELVTVSAALSSAGDRVTDSQGRPVSSQRLASGELVLLARDVPPLATKRFNITAGSPHTEGHATAEGGVLDSGIVRVRVDQATGGIVELTAKGLVGNFSDTTGGEAVNDYLYLQGDDLKDLKRNGLVKISVGEQGPLIASLIIESAAPGCKKLRRELRVVAGQDYVELINLVDKTRLPAADYLDKLGKESVNFAFPFNVPDGELLLDIPLGVMRPETDQLPGACKNWLTVGRWVDVSNQERGITWVTLDAPLIEVGSLTATLLNSQTNPDIWRKRIGPTQRFYSWAMNNHWGTNYRAYQEGPTVFRFVLRPHRQPDPAAAARFATGFTQPLLVQPAQADSPTVPLLKITPQDVLATALKPSDDGRAMIVRVFGASGRACSAQLHWGLLKPKAVFLSDTSEKAGQRIKDSVAVPAYGLVTLRAEFE